MDKKVSKIVLGLFLFITNTMACHAAMEQSVATDPLEAIYEYFKTDADEYEELFRFSFHPDGVSENVNHLPCTLDKKSTQYRHAEQCVKDLLKSGGWLIIGDSHGRDLYNTLKMLYPEKNIGMFQQSSCAPAKALKQGTDDIICFEHMDKIMEFVNNDDRVQAVFFAAVFAGESGTKPFINDIREGRYKKNIIIFNAGPIVAGGPVKYVENHGIQETYLLPERSVNLVLETNELIESLLSSQVKIFSKFHAFCSYNNSCKLLDNDRIMFRDSGHLLRGGMHYYGAKIRESNILGSLK